MEIAIQSFFGLTEIALLPVPQVRLARTVIDGMIHWSLDGQILLTVDSEARRILFAHHTVTVIHQLDGHEQRFIGMEAAA